MGQTTFSGPVVSQNGFIENSFTTAQRDAIANPTAGLLIYNTTVNAYQVYNGTTWQPAFSAPVPPPPPPVGTTYSSANGDWPSGINGFQGGVSWGGGYDIELDFSTSISAPALAAFEALVPGNTIVINTNGTNYTVQVTASYMGFSPTEYVYLNTSNPSGYAGGPDIVDSVTFLP
jgi:hypothetical protein